MLNRTKEIRAFIAIELPEGVKFFLKELVAELRSFGGSVRWTRPESMHLTLKFLGNVKSEILADLQTALSPVFTKQKPFPLTLSGVGAFPSLNKARVIWAGLDDPSGLSVSLAAELEDTLEPFGFQKEKRSFTPHLTLGRVKSGIGSSDLVGAMRQMSTISGPEFLADHAVLFESILKSSGAEYSSLFRFDFSSG